MYNLTRNGVALDIAETPYIFTEFIEGDKFDFHFSSKLHLDNFKKKRSKNFEMIYNYIYKRFKYRIDCRKLADLNLYTKIESRGFFVKINDKEYLWPESITLSGELKMKRSLEE